MSNFLKIYIIKTIKKVTNLLLLYNLLLVYSCNCNKENDRGKNNSDNPSANPNEVIVFLGNPGVGKSTLCNSILGDAVFSSGISIGKGPIATKKEHIHENKLYIDTPGLDDVKFRAQAAEEIEKALKHNNNYKLVFVAMLDSGRIRAADLVTINIICDAIKTDFEYGLVFNQVLKKVARVIDQQKLDYYLKALHKAPSLTVILTRDDDIEGEKDMYFQGSHENRQKLLKLIDDLKAKKIAADDVKKLDVINFETKISEVKKDMK